VLYARIVTIAATALVLVQVCGMYRLGPEASCSVVALAATALCSMQLLGHSRRCRVSTLSVLLSQIYLSQTLLSQIQMVCAFSSSCCCCCCRCSSLMTCMRHLVQCCHLIQSSGVYRRHTAACSTACLTQCVFVCTSKRGDRPSACAIASAISPLTGS
jgi:hypothetical protein